MTANKEKTRTPDDSRLLPRQISLDLNEFCLVPTLIPSLSVLARKTTDPDDPQTVHEDRIRWGPDGIDFYRRTHDPRFCEPGSDYYALSWAELRGHRDTGQNLAMGEFVIRNGDLAWLALLEGVGYEDWNEARAAFATLLSLRFAVRPGDEPRMKENLE